MISTPAGHAIHPWIGRRGGRYRGLRGKPSARGRDRPTRNTVSTETAREKSSTRVSGEMGSITSAGRCTGRAWEGGRGPGAGRQVGERDATAAPDVASTALSHSVWRMRRAGVAPTARRTASSARRAAPRASNRPATLAQTISNRTPTRAIRSFNAGPYLSRRMLTPRSSRIELDPALKLACQAATVRIGAVDLFGGGFPEGTGLGQGLVLARNAGLQSRGEIERPLDSFRRCGPRAGRSDQRVHTHRHADIRGRVEGGAIEFARHYSDDGEHVAVENDGAADGGRIGIEAAFPEGVAEDGGKVGGGFLCVGGSERTAVAGGGRLRLRKTRESSGRREAARREQGGSWRRATLLLRKAV